MNKQCTFCYRMCNLSVGQIGPCGVRIHDGEEIRGCDNQKIVASHLDPIEKKPMYHFFPQTMTYSIGMLGCNIECQYCQNYHITMKPYINNYGTSKETSIPNIIKNLKDNNSYIMSYTYSEPIVWQDEVIAIAKEVRKEGMYNLLVTNGTFSEESLHTVGPLIDAINIDVKGNEDFYSTYAKAPHVLDAVYRTLEYFINKSSAIVEVTTLIIEPIHTKKMIQEMAHRLKEVGVKVWHLSRFFPTYRMRNYEPTSNEYLQTMVDIAKDSGIEYVYKGNVHSPQDKHITCHHCGALLKRSKVKGLVDETGLLHCPSCNTLIYGKFSHSLARQQ